MLKEGMAMVCPVGGSSWGCREGDLGSLPAISPCHPLPLLTCVADAAEVPQDVVVGGVGVISHLGE